MRTHATKPMNINGAILTDEILEEIVDFQDLAMYYCENLSFLKDFLIRLLGDNYSEADTQKLITILSDIVCLNNFMRSLVIENEEAAV